MVAAWTLARVLLTEVVGRERSPRVPEPEMVMADPAQVADYTAAGRSGGVMSPTHLLHTAQATSIIRPGDHVIDLGCGPGTQLVQLAQLHPEAHFTGVDLSVEMLASAHRHAEELGLTNVSWHEADITNLPDIADGACDVVISVMTLHHLPTADHLHRCMAEARRVLTPGGRVYFADFARLRSASSMHLLAHLRDAMQPACFTRDYYNSLRAAFAAEQLREAAFANGLVTAAAARHHVTWPIGIMQAVKSRAHHEPAGEVRRRLRAWQAQLSATAKEDLLALRRIFRFAGLVTPL